MLKNRLITGVLVAAFFLAMILFAPVWVLLVLMCAVYLLAQLEYCEMCERSGYKLERIGIFACGLLYLGAVVCQDVFQVIDADIEKVLLYLIPAFFVAQSVLRRKTERAAECIGLSLLGFWYVAVLLSFMVRIALEHECCSHNCTIIGATTMERLTLISFVVFVKMSDIGAYTFGMLWGHKIKRRLIPEISPAKSIPGLFGAYAGSLLAATGLSVLVVCVRHKNGLDALPMLQHLWIFALGLLMATVGVMGDLVESLLKRSFGIKDSSSRFPGMGGFLDILDSLLFAAPFMYLFMKFVK